MERYVIEGGNRLAGCISVQGSKNSVLPIIAASILNNGKSVIHNCPDISDVRVALKILKQLGGEYEFSDNILVIDAENISQTSIPDDLAAEMRSSVIFAGALIARFMKAKVHYPGGCEIGPRPIDLHLKGFTKLGCTVSEIDNGCVMINADRIKGSVVNLEYPSVGATENIMLAASGSEEETVIINAAKEPEICDLAAYLKLLGICISGEGTSVINIRGCSRIKRKVEFKVMSDRIVAGTYLMAAATTKGEITLTDFAPDSLHSLLEILKESGCDIITENDKIHLSAPKRLKSVNIIRTMPYPGFPTDLQAPISALLTTCEGTSIIIETIFENRFKHVNELLRMGADIVVDGRSVILKGVKKLKGAYVSASDLRGGAALVIAGLMAEGRTIIEGAHHVDRGYENIEKNIIMLGGNINKIKI